MEEIEKDSGRDMTPRLIGETWRKYPTEKSMQKATYGLFECQYCKKEFECQVPNVKNGSTKSCGCYINIERLREAATTHGMSQNKYYNTWKRMLHRCSSPKNKDYKSYGGRGITVCEEWLDVTNFVAWCDLTRPNIEGLSLDRIDVNGNYEPSNCRWADRTTQAVNQRIKGNNTSGFVGVDFRPSENKYVARISILGDRVHIGCFPTKEEAVLARDNYIIENNLPHKLSTEYKKE